MSLIKQILSPFVEFEEEKKVEQKAEIVKESQPPVIPNYAAPINENAIHPLINGPNATAPTDAQTTALRNNVITALPEHEQYFEKLIDDANTKNPLFAGTDYKEFVDSKTAIGDLTDEETKYKSAFNILKRSGLTKEKLISTAQEYHNIIGRDMNAFQGAHSLQYRKEVRQREELIQKKAEELRALSEKINALKKEISQISQQMTETKDKLDLTKNSFLFAGESKQKEIQTELEKITRFF